MSTFTRVVWPVCVAATLVLSGCVVDTTESEDIDEERTGEVYLELDGTSGEDEESDNQRTTLEDGTSTGADEGALAVPHAEPDPEPWDPGDGHGSDDT